MKKVSIIGVDLAKNVFQLHGAAADGTVVFRKKLSRPQFQRFMAEHPPCLSRWRLCRGAITGRGSSAGYGHQVRLIAPRYVKPFIKRQKNDAADAEAIVEAALRPTMRFVEPKTADQQAQAVVFRTREQFVKQRTEAINALRCYLYEFGYIAPEGIGIRSGPREDRRGQALGFACSRPGHLQEGADTDRELTEHLAELKKRIAAMSREVQPCRAGCRRCRASVRSAPWPSRPSRRRWSSSDEARDFAAWLGLVPRQHSSGGKQRLGKTSKMGQRDIRRLLITGAMAVIRWALRAMAPRRIPGWRACWNASLRWSPPSRWPTRWRAASGRC